MEWLVIISGFIIFVGIFWLGYLTASMMFVAKQSDELDIQEQKKMNNIERNK